jgi:hypothetical protein
MDKNVVDDLKSKFGPVKFFSGPFKTIPGNWFLLELNPIPLNSEIKDVTSDICRNASVKVSNGKVKHDYDNCDQENHSFSSKSRHVEKIISDLKDKKYYIAVYPGDEKILNGQPIAIPLKPEINYIRFPDHPHLNTMGAKDVQIDGFNFHLPDSLCYTSDPNELGTDKSKRLLYAFDLITIWLFRHEIWLKTKESYGKGTWIGPEAARFSPYIYPQILNPLGKCRCGKNKKYVDCHRSYDMKKLRKMKKKNNKISLNSGRISYQTAGSWENNICNPQKRSLDILQNILL